MFLDNVKFSGNKNLEGIEPDKTVRLLAREWPQHVFGCPHDISQRNINRSLTQR